MPAPTPIVFRYGDPRDIANIGLAAGNAESARYHEQQQYQQYMQQQQLDAAFLRQIASQSAEDQWRRNEIQARPDSANALQSAAGYPDTGVETFRGDDPALMEKLLAQKAGKTSTKGLAATPVSLVPSEGSTGSSGGGASIEGGGRKTEIYNGLMMQTQNGNTQLQNWGGRGPQADMVTPGVRAQLDYLRDMEGQIPPDRMNALMTAARSGGLKMDQLVDDARQAVPTSSNRLSAEARGVDNHIAELSELKALGGLPPADQAQYARRKYNMQDPDIYSDQDAIGALQSRARQLNAMTQPVSNSSGRTLTGGNPVPVSSPDEARRLPPGTYFKTPDGRVMKVPQK